VNFLAINQIPGCMQGTLLFPCLVGLKWIFCQ